MRDPRRCALHLLLDAPPRRRPEIARPHRARRDRSARGQPWPLRRAQDKGGAVAGRHNRQSQAHLPDNEGKQPGQRVREQKVQASSRRAQRGRRAERGGEALRRPRAAHPRVQRLDLRARRRRLELRLPAGRPAQPRDNGTFRGAAQGCRPSEGGVRDARAPDVRHQGVPHGQGLRVRQREDRRDAGCLRHRAVAVEKGSPYDNAVDESTNKILKAEFVYREAFGTTRELQVKLADYVHWYNNFRLHSTLGYMAPVEFRKAGLVLSELPK